MSFLSSLFSSVAGGAVAQEGAKAVVQEGAKAVVQEGAKEVFKREIVKEGAKEVVKEAVAPVPKTNDAMQIIGFPKDAKDPQQLFSFVKSLRNLSSSPPSNQQKQSEDIQLLLNNLKRKQF